MRNIHVSLRDRVQEIEEIAIREALGSSGWVKARAARVLGITERMIGYKIKKYGIKKEGSAAGKPKGEDGAGRNASA